MPNKLQIGNVADLGEETQAYSELDGVMAGGAIEGMIGWENWFAESWGGFSGMLTRYHRIMNRLAAPKLGIFHHMGQPTDYQGFRYGLTSCLMNIITISVRLFKTQRLLHGKKGFTVVISKMELHL